MIYARIDNSIKKNILGFECGNRADFDRRHGNDPLWIFLDSDIVLYRMDKEAFFLFPTAFYIDAKGLVQKRSDPKVRTVLPFVYLVDKDGALLQDQDGFYLTEPR